MINPRLNIDKEVILSKVTVQELYSHFFNITKVPCVINSPLRSDSHPSFSLQSPDGVNIFYKDFSTGESGDIFKLLQSYWQVSYEEVLNRIYKEIININTYCTVHKSIKNPKHVIKVKTSSIIEDTQVSVRKWKDWDIEYWKSYGITLDFLQKANVHPISYIYLTIEGKISRFPADKHAYVFVEFKDNKPSLKIYQPFNKTHKWRNTNDASVWSLWNLLPQKGDKLIITSSLKDAACIYCNTGIPSCSLQSESYLPKESVINELKQRFTTIYVLYDNDFKSKKKNSGRILGNKIASLYNLVQIEIPERFGSKDSSDLYKNKGAIVFQEVIKMLLRQAGT